MENKYYTPDLSEFYFGFEYEQSSDISEDLFTVEKFWKKFTMSSDYTMLMIYHIYKNNAQEEFFRVKYLNEVDLKNFGLTKEEYNLEDYPFLRYYHVDPKIKEYILYKFTTKYKCLQFWYSPNIKNDYCNLIITCFNDKDNLNCHFKGYIKNKSELQKLLKQLGINE